MYQFGPYAPNHATAGTFAFKEDYYILKNITKTHLLLKKKNF